MNFDLTPEQQRIRAEVRRFAEQEIAPRAVTSMRRASFLPKHSGKWRSWG